MATPAEIKSMVQEGIAGLKKEPDAGRGTAVTTVRVRKGVACDIEDGPWKLVADEMPGDGGDGLGPDAGVFARAGLGACLAQGYVMWAAARDVPIDSLEVVVEGDYDAAAMMGLADERPPGFSEVRYSVSISSTAAAEKVREMVEYADRHSSILDLYRRAVPVKRTLQTSKTGDR